MRSLPFLLHEALINLRRHGLMTVAAVTTLAVALTLCGAFLMGFVQITALVHRGVDAFEVRVFCRQKTSPEELAAIRRRLSTLPGVAYVDFKDKATVFAEQTRAMPIDTAGLPNLLPDTFVLKLTDARQASGVARIIRGWQPQVENVEFPEQEMRTMVRIANFLRTLGIACGALLLLGALVVVANTVRLSVFSRRREIRIMQILGATAWFIRLPLLMEGLIHGLAGGALAGALLAALYGYVDRELTRQVPLIANNAAVVPLEAFCAALVGIGATLGVLGSLFSIRRYLKHV